MAEEESKKKSWLMDMLAEGSKISFMRVLSGVIAIFGCWTLWFQLRNYTPDQINWEGPAIIIGLAIGGKMAQKFGENR
jgi:drug/metabolite transporter superfamily protein YnfA